MPIELISKILKAVIRDHSVFLFWVGTDHCSQSQQTTIFSETAQESGGSCPTTSAFLRHSNSTCSRILCPSLALCHHSITGWTVRVNTKVCYSHHLSFHSGHVISWYIVRLWTYLPWIQAWPTLKVILSRYYSPILFPLSFIPASTWYVCLVSAQNGHTVSMSCLMHQKILLLY